MSTDDRADTVDRCAAMAEATSHRETLILGQPPRVLPTQAEAVVRAAQLHLTKLRGNAPETAGSVAIADIPDMVLTLLGCHPDLYELVASVSVYLLGKTTLPRRDFELLVLRTDWLCQSPYNWGEHVKIAKRSGVSAEEIERVICGSDATGWSEHDRALLRAAEELHADAMISDATWAILAKRFSEKQLFEVIVLVGQFTLVTYFQNSLRLRLSAGNEGLRAR